MGRETEISGPERMTIGIAICTLHTEHCNPIFLRGISGFDYNGKLKRILLVVTSYMPTILIRVNYTYIPSAYFTVP